MDRLWQTREHFVEMFQRQRDADLVEDKGSLADGIDLVTKTDKVLVGLRMCGWWCRVDDVWLTMCAARGGPGLPAAQGGLPGLCVHRRGDGSRRRCAETDG